MVAFILYRAAAASFVISQASPNAKAPAIGQSIITADSIPVPKRLCLWKKFANQPFIISVPFGAWHVIHLGCIRNGWRHGADGHIGCTCTCVDRHGLAWHSANDVQWLAG